MIYLFIDTNVLLHYRRLEEIDWLGFSHSDEAVLLLSPVIIRELERQKITHPQRKLRKRAQEVVLNLHSKLTGSSEIRKGVGVEFITSDPRIDFASYKLRPEINDDWLLATVLEWKLEHQEADIRIVSADLGMSIKAKSYGVSVLIPLEADRLAEELDTDERRIIQLQRELAELRSSLPELRLVFMDGKTVAQFRTLPDLPIDLSYLETELKQLRAKYPELPIAPELSGPAQ